MSTKAVCFVIALYFFKNGLAIKSGNYTNPGEFPAALFVYTAPLPNVFNCSAIIVDAKWALTTARCAERAQSNPLYINLYTGVDSPVAEGIEHHVVRVVTHPDYDRITRFNDLALLHVEEPFEEGNQETPLPFYRDFIGVGADVIAVGWSTVEGRQLSSQQLTISANDCFWQYYENELGPYNPNDVCGQSVYNDREFEAQDEGGPLVSWDGKMLVGMTRIAVEENENANVFIRLAPYVLWIDYVINGS